MQQKEIDPDLQSKLRSLFLSAAVFTLAPLFVYHLYCIRKHYETTFKKRKLSLYLSLGMFLWGLIFNCRFWINHEFGYTKFSCYTGVIFSIPSYYLFKLNIYLILCHRLYCVFGSNFYKPLYIKLFAVFISLWSLTNLIVINIGFTVEWDPNPVAGPPCDLNANPLGYDMQMVEDIVVTVVFIFLFVKPIMQLRNDMKDTHGADDLMKVAVKQCVLAITALLITAAALLGMKGLDLPAVFICSDFIISTICILLMYQWNEGAVNFLCYCFLSKYSHNKEEQQLKMIVAAPSNSSVGSSGTGTTNTTAFDTIDIANDKSPDSNSIDIVIPTTTTTTIPSNVSSSEPTIDNQEPTITAQTVDTTNDQI